MRNVVTSLSIALMVSSPSWADPCGMVPPIWEGAGSPIQRVGPQKTYAFFQNGVETFVIRPGFSGKVDNFGMLIPFPSVPAIRKVPDETFQHIAAAIDPPEVIIDLNPYLYDDEMMDMAPSESGAEIEEEKLEYDEVKVLKQEAVGMYEIAVLEAGSPKALSRWMEQHGFQYPKGMDRPVEDYVKARWCFVAVKTRVGAKGQVDPKPGMRQADATLPAGASFDGHVQAMGFRFLVDKPVIPMRLSTFNDSPEGARNIVYLVTPETVKIEGLPGGLVKRQLKGQRLLENVTKDLPLRILGGTLADVSKTQLEALKPSRRPEPHNGAARDLLASDLLAAKTRQLAHDFEEREKQLLNVNERLNLRGPEIDAQADAELKKERETTVLSSLPLLPTMTLTVIDGDLPKEHLAATNLSFVNYQMPAHLNLRAAYQARNLGPEGQQGGVRVEWDGRQTDDQRENPVLRFWKDLWD